jgi:hypothetical protein
MKFEIRQDSPEILFWHFQIANTLATKDRDRNPLCGSNMSLARFDHAAVNALHRAG